jgi:lipopolysaccharide export system protein LptC
MTASRFFSFLLLCIITSLTWWLESVVSSSQNEALKQKSNRPDFYMKNFTLRNYTTNGELKYKAIGESLIRYPKDDSLEIEQLDMQAYKQDEAPLNINANNARITNNGDHILLTGAVDIQQAKYKDNDSLSIQTEKLFMDNLRDYMETNKAITIQTSKHKMQGIGMQAWLEHKKYRLFSQVRGVHEP